MPSAEPTVFVVDDDRGMQKALRTLFEANGMQVESWESAGEFLRSYSPDRPGCLVLDVRMPGMDGVELQRTLVSEGIGIPIIFLTGHGDMSMAVDVMRLGAVHFFAKPFEKHELLNAAKEAMEMDAQSRRERRERAEVETRVATLSPREREVLDLLLAGYANKRMAARLGITERTIEFHRSHIMQKMETPSVAELARLVTACQADRKNA